jgi:hypothetical protein
MNRNYRLSSPMIGALCRTTLRVRLNTVQREVKPVGTKPYHTGRLAKGSLSTQALVDTKRGGQMRQDSDLPVKLRRWLSRSVTKSDDALQK